MTDLDTQLQDMAPEADAPFAMKAPEALQKSTLFITKSALERLAVLRDQHTKKADHDPKRGAPALRIAVLSGGCYGFQYKFDFDHTVNDDDYVFSHNDISITVDTTSYDLLENVVLDYVQDLIGSAFTLKNPNSESSCGCGNSFSL